MRDVVRGFILAECMPDEEPASLGDDMELQSSGILDSLALLKLVTVIEKHTGLELQARDLTPANFETVDLIVSFVEGLAAQRGPK